MSEADFPSLMIPVAKELWGDPNEKLTTPKKVCWGSNGSRTVTVEKGTWFDFEANEGGGVLALVQSHFGLDKDRSLAWLAENGFIDPKRGQEAPETTAQPRNEQSDTSAHQEQEHAPADGVKTPVCGYDYHDADGNKLYQVVRLQWKLPDGSFVIDPKTGNPKKTFFQRRKDSAGNIVYNLDGIGHTIYHHPEIEIGIAEGKTIFLVEGEKDCDTLAEWDLVASTNSGGAQHWKPHLAEYFRGADIVIIPDNDEVGHLAAESRAKSLKGIAARIRVLDLAQHVQNFGSKFDVTDWRDKMGGTPEALQTMIDRVPDWTPRPPQSTFGAKQMVEISNKPIVYDWLIKHLVERNGVLIVAGESQAGKSFFVMDMGMKIARGLEYGGRKTRQGLVIHMACEDGRGTQLRMEGYRRENAIHEESNLPYLIMDPTKGGGFTLMSDESVDKFIAECLAWEEWYGQKLEMVIIDTLSVATEGLDEINGAEAGKVLARVNRIKDKTGATICLVHHMNASGTRVRGHSSIVANVPNLIEVRPMMTIPARKMEKPEPILDSDGRQMRRAILAKNKNGLNDVKWTFVLKVVDLGTDNDGDTITTCVCAKASRQQRSEAEERPNLSPDQKLVFDAMKAAQEDAGISMPAGARVGPQIKTAAPMNTFVSYVRKQMTFKSGEDEIEARNGELSSFLKRTTTSLITNGYMGRDNDLKIVWWTGKSDAPRRTVQHAEPTVPSAVVNETAPQGMPF